MLLDRINSTGSVYMNHTIVDGVYMLRCAVRSTLTEELHVVAAWKLIKEEVDALTKRVESGVWSVRMGSWCEAKIKPRDDVSCDLLQVSILWSSEGKNQVLLLNDLLRSRLREQFVMWVVVMKMLIICLSWISHNKNIQIISNSVRSKNNVFLVFLIMGLTKVWGVKVYYAMGFRPS